jgi:hypothetical protein
MRNSDAKMKLWVCDSVPHKGTTPQKAIKKEHLSRKTGVRATNHSGSAEGGAIYVYSTHVETMKTQNSSRDLRAFVPEMKLQ